MNSKMMEILRLAILKQRVNLPLAMNARPLGIVDHDSND